MSTATDFRVAARIASFPFPFSRDTYRYSANVEPAGAAFLDVGEGYYAEIAERERILAADPTRFQALPHMEIAQWDALLEIMRGLAAEYPRTMMLERDGRMWRWTNRALDIEQAFVYGERSTLPEPPLRYIGRQIQEDVVLLDQREGQLWGDAGLVTFAADWSLRFDVGMSFLQIHGPVPRVHTEGVVARAQNFLMRLQTGERYRRTNWTLTVDGRLDTSTETYPEWGRDRRTLAEGPLAEVGARLHLRVEVQHLIRLGQSGAIMFLVRTHLLSFAEIAQVPEWARRLRSVLAELPDDMAEYKGLTRTRQSGVDWLDRYALA